MAADDLVMQDPKPSAGHAIDLTMTTPGYWPSVRFCSILLAGISQEVLQISIHKMGLNIILFKLLSHLPVDNECWAILPELMLIYNELMSCQKNQRNLFQNNIIFIEGNAFEILSVKHGSHFDQCVWSTHSGLVTLYGDIDWVIIGSCKGL